MMNGYLQPGVEPELDAVLHDPIILMMMQSDGVKHEEIVELMHRAHNRRNGQSRTRH